MLNVLYVKFGIFYQSFLEHNHSMKSYELHYIPRGQGILVANGSKYPIEPDTLYMTGPDIVHEQNTVLSDPMEEYCICFEVLTNNINDDPDLSFIARPIRSNNLLVRSGQAEYDAIVRAALL